MRLVTEAATAATADDGHRIWTAAPRSTLDAAARARGVFETISADPERLVSLGWLPEELFWSRYFWYKLFALLEARHSGADAGLEQQAFRLLEHPEPHCHPDWSVGEEVEQRVVAAAQVVPCGP